MAVDLTVAARTHLETAARVRVRPRSRPRSWGRWFLTAAVLSWFALMIVVPTIALLRAAFAGGLAAFLGAVASEGARRAFGLTIALAGVSTVINTIFGVGFSMVLVRQRFWGKTLVDGLVDLPFAVSPVVAGLMLVVLYGPASSLGGWLDHLGLRVVYHWPGMVLVNLFVTLPFVVREVVPVLREFGVDQEEVAQTLGAGRWTTFWRVTLPSVRWGLAYGVTLTIARALGEFGALLVVSGNVLGRTQTTTLYIHEQVESFFPESAYAASVVLAGVSFALLLGMETLRRRMTGHERLEE